MPEVSLVFALRLASSKFFVLKLKLKLKMAIIRSETGVPERCYVDK